MLGFVQNWLGPKPNPIGVDFGSDALRMAQVSVVDGEHRLTAAATCDIPAHVRHNAEARLQFFVEATKDLLATGGFRGRQAVLALPAATMFIQHLRVSKMDDAELKKALPWEARGKLPIDPSLALLRHVVAGEIYHDHDPKLEVVVMAAAREAVNQFLAAAAKAKLDVVGMNVEPAALLDCFSHIYRRKTDATLTNCFVDVGCAGSRAVITRGRQILFARTIAVGGDHFNRAVSTGLGISFDDAKMLRVKLAHCQSEGRPVREKVSVDTARNPERAGLATERAGEAESMEQAFPLLGAALAAENKGRGAAGAERKAAEAAVEDEAVAVAAPEPAEPETRPALAAADAAQQAKVEQACAEPLAKLVEELEGCRRYYEATFPNKPIDRLVFVGGEARQRALCQNVARELGLAAQVGDPLVRMGRTSELGVESGIDRRQPQPGWAVAIGLSMGPTDKAPDAE